MASIRLQVKVGKSRMVAQKAVYLAYHGISPSEINPRQQIRQQCLYSDGSWWCLEPTHLAMLKTHASPIVIKHDLPGPPHAILPLVAPVNLRFTMRVGGAGSQSPGNIGPSSNHDSLGDPDGTPAADGSDPASRFSPRTSSTQHQYQHRPPHDAPSYALVKTTVGGGATRETTFGPPGTMVATAASWVGKLPPVLTSRSTTAQSSGTWEPPAATAQPSGAWYADRPTTPEPSGAWEPPLSPTVRFIADRDMGALSWLDDPLDLDASAVDSPAGTDIFTGLIGGQEVGDGHGLPTMPGWLDQWDHRMAGGVAAISQKGASIQSKFQPPPGGAIFQDSSGNLSNQSRFQPPPIGDGLSFEDFNVG